MNSRVTTIHILFIVVAVIVMKTGKYLSLYTILNCHHCFTCRSCFPPYCIAVEAFFEAEQNMYYRHKASLMYDTIGISFAFTAAELPFLLATCCLYTKIFYFLLGFAADAGMFFFYYMFMWLCTAFFTYLGQNVCGHQSRCCDC